MLLQRNERGTKNVGKAVVRAQGLRKKRYMGGALCAAVIGEPGVTVGQREQSFAFVGNGKPSTDSGVGMRTGQQRVGTLRREHSACSVLDQTKTMENAYLTRQRSRRGADTGSRVGGFQHRTTSTHQHHHRTTPSCPHDPTTRLAYTVYSRERPVAFV